jgi:hypothetical protein
MNLRWRPLTNPRPAPATRTVRLKLEELEPRLVLTDALTVHANTILNSIAYPYVGVNYSDFWDPLSGSSASRQALANAGVQVIRFGGGEPANYFNWSDPYHYSSIYEQTSTDDLGAYAGAIGAQLLLQTNPTTNGGNDPSGAHWADWLRYVESQGYSAPYWEVGNENDGSGAGGAWAVGGTPASPNYSNYQNYITKFNAHAQALKGVDPNVLVFGNAGTNEYQWWGLGSLNYFLQQTGNKTSSGLVDGVSVHIYPSYQRYPGWDNVKGLAQGWGSRWTVIRNDIAANDTRNLPVFITETNAADGDQAGSIVTTVASALANLDWLEALRNSGVQQADFFGSIHGVGNGWGLLYGRGDWHTAETASPKYYVLPFLSAQGNRQLGVTGLTDPSGTLSAYASLGTNGNYQVVLINKSSQARDVSLAFDGFDPTGKALHIYELKGASGGIWDSDVIYNGVRNPDVTSSNGLPGPLTGQASGPTYTHTVPAYSMTLIEFVVNKAHPDPVVRIASPADTGTFPGGGPIWLGADAYATVGNLARVEFYANGALVATATGGNTYALWDGASAGNYTLTAVAYDDGGGVSQSAPVTVTVSAGGGAEASPLRSLPPPQPGEGTAGGPAAAFAGLASDDLSGRIGPEGKVTATFASWTAPSEDQGLTVTSRADRQRAPSTSDAPRRRQPGTFLAADVLFALESARKEQGPAWSDDLLQ